VTWFIGQSAQNLKDRCPEGLVIDWFFEEGHGACLKGLFFIHRWSAARDQDDWYSGQFGKAPKPLHDREAIPFHCPTWGKINIEQDELDLALLYGAGDCFRIAKGADVETIRFESHFECFQDECVIIDYQYFTAFAGWRGSLRWWLRLGPFWQKGIFLLRIDFTAGRRFRILDHLKE